MSLAEHAETPDDEPIGEVVPRTEFDGHSGYLQTGVVENPPNDFDALLREFGYDPERVQIVGAPQVSRWQQRSRKLEKSEDGERLIKTSEFETVWLSAYKFRLAQRALAVDLPALYNELRHTKPSAPAKPVGESTVVVCWADIQCGKTDHLGGIKELLQRLDEKRAALAAYLERTSFDHIIIADVGDIVEGFDNVQSQTRMNSLSLMDQVDVASTEFWKTIKLCAEHAPVDVLSIPSNHCQWRRGKDLVGKPTDDWGLHISRILERHNAEIGLPVTFHRPDEWHETLTFDVRGTRLGLAHGHQASGADRVKTWWEKMTHSGTLDCHILLTGHFHFASLRPHGKDAQTGRARWHIQAATLDNGSAWVMNKMGEDGDPALTVFQIDNDGFDVTSFALL